MRAHAYTHTHDMRNQKRLKSFSERLWIEPLYMLVLAPQYDMQIHFNYKWLHPTEITAVVCFFFHHYQKIAKVQTAHRTLAVYRCSKNTFLNLFLGFFFPSEILLHWIFIRSTNTISDYMLIITRKTDRFNHLSSFLCRLRGPQRAGTSGDTKEKSLQIRSLDQEMHTVKLRFCNILSPVSWVL